MRGAWVVARLNRKNALKHHFARENLFARAQRKFVTHRSCDCVGQHSAIHRGNNRDRKHVTERCNIATEVSEHADLTNEGRDEAVTRRIDLNEIEELLARLVTLLHRHHFKTKRGLDDFFVSAVNGHAKSL